MKKVDPFRSFFFS